MTDRPYSFTVLDRQPGLGVRCLGDRLGVELNGERLTVRTARFSYFVRAAPRVARSSFIHCASLCRHTIRWRACSVPGEPSTSPSQREHDCSRVTLSKSPSSAHPAGRRGFRSSAVDSVDLARGHLTIARLDANTLLDGSCHSVLPSPASSSAPQRWTESKTARGLPPIEPWPPERSSFAKSQPPFWSPRLHPARDGARPSCRLRSGRRGARRWFLVAKLSVSVYP